MRTILFILVSLSLGGCVTQKTSSSTGEDQASRVQKNRELQEAASSASDRVYNNMARPPVLVQVGRNPSGI